MVYTGLARTQNGGGYLTEFEMGPTLSMTLMPSINVYYQEKQEFQLQLLIVFMGMPTEQLSMQASTFSRPLNPITLFQELSLNT